MFRLEPKTLNLNPKPENRNFKPQAGVQQPLWDLLLRQRAGAEESGAADAVPLWQSLVPCLEVRGTYNPFRVEGVGLGFRV